jgi:hypothetical protein
MVAATAKRSNDRVLKACHRVFIKLHEIGYLDLPGWRLVVNLTTKSRILDKIEKRLTKMS